MYGFVGTIVFICITTIILSEKIDRKFRRLRKALNLPEEDS